MAVVEFFSQKFEAIKPLSSCLNDSRKDKTKSSCSTWTPPIFLDSTYCKRESKNEGLTVLN